MQSNIAERRAQCSAETASLAIRRWELTLELEGIDRRLRFLKGVDSEGQVSQTEIDALQSMNDAQAAALEEWAKSAKESPAVVEDATP